MNKSISDAITIVLYALKQGPVYLIAIFAKMLKENEMLRSLQKVNIYEDTHEHHRNICSEKGYFEKSNGTSLSYSHGRKSGNYQNILKRESHNQRQTQFTFYGDDDKTQEENPVSPTNAEMAPHPLLGCSCDVCQKLILIPNMKIHCLSTRYGLILPPNCIVLLKGNIYATVSYVGHRRKHLGIIDEKFHGKQRPLGVSTYVWKLENEEYFFSLGDIKAIFSPNSSLLFLKNDEKTLRMNYTRSALNIDSQVNKGSVKNCSQYSHKNHCPSYPNLGLCPFGKMSEETYCRCRYLSSARYQRRVSEPEPNIGYPFLQEHCCHNSLSSRSLLSSFDSAISLKFDENRLYPTNCSLANHHERCHNDINCQKCLKTFHSVGSYYCKS